MIDNVCGFNIPAPNAISTVDIVHYALGGGLGHITRTLAIREYFGYHSTCITLCSPRFLNLEPFHSQLNLVSPPDTFSTHRDELRDWVYAQLLRYQPRIFCVDTFPGGLLGELCEIPSQLNLPTMEWHWVARALKWDTYSQVLPGRLPKFDRLFSVEPLPEEQVQSMKDSFGLWESLKLKPPSVHQPPLGFHELLRRWASLENPIWLLVHTGSDSEWKELFDYAFACAKMESIVPHWAAVMPENSADFMNWERSRPQKVEVVNLSPSVFLFPFVDKIFSGGGFNVMLETERFRYKHRPLPFPRRFDDQFARIARSQPMVL